MKISLGLAAQIILLVVCSSTVCCTQTDVATRAAEMSRALITAHTAWDTKASGPGASIQAKEVARRGSLVQYHLYVSGLPKDQLYTVISWPINRREPSPAMKGVTIGNDGIVMCAGRTPEQCGDPSKKDDPIEFTFSPAKGEPYRLALAGGDYRAAIVIVPDPIVAKDKGCSLTVERLLPHFELAYFNGSGFPPSSDVSFDAESYGEKHLMKTKTDAEGNLKFAAMPFVVGRQKGTTTVKAIGVNCSPLLEFDWGN